MKQRKGKIIDLIYGNDDKVSGIKLKVYRTKLKKAVAIC